MYKRNNKRVIDVKSFWDFFLSSEERISMYYELISINQKLYM